MANSHQDLQTPPWISAYMTVRDVDVSANFYSKAFKFEIVDLISGEDGTHCHGELKYKNQLVMIGKEGVWQSTTKTPATSAVESPMNLYVYCDNVDLFYQSAVAAGAKSLAEPEDMFWGDRMCKLQDPDGYMWCFATYPQKKS